MRGQLLNAIFPAHIDPVLDPDSFHQHSHRFSVFLLVLIAGSFIYGTISILFFSHFPQIAPVSATVGIHILSLVLNRVGFYKTSVLLTIAFFTISIPFFTYMGKNVNDLFLLILPVLVAALNLSIPGLMIYLAIINSLNIFVIMTNFGISLDSLRVIGFFIPFSILLVLFLSHRERLQKKREKILNDTLDASVFALAYQAELRDQGTGAHLERTRQYTRLLVKELAANRELSPQFTTTFIQDMEKASLLHDIGKVGISDTILLKPGELTKEEFEEIKQHTIYGIRIIEIARQRLPYQTFFSLAAHIVLYHHEWWDGSGYPEGRQGETIPLSARIMALADTYDALRSPRPYKKPLPHDQCVEIIWKAKGSQFDPRLVDSFLRIEKSFHMISTSISD